MEETQGEIGDRFASIIQFCIPTPSQEAKLQSCPFACEFEHFAGVDVGTFQSTSAEPTQTARTPIAMVSVPGSVSSPKDDAVFVTPPDHHQHLSSSEDQNVFHECARTVDLGEDVPKEADKGTVDGAGETVDVNETEVVVGLGDGETMKANETEVICLDSVDTVNAEEDTMEVTGEDGLGKPSKSNVSEDGSERKKADKNVTFANDGGEKFNNGKHERMREAVEVEKEVLGSVRKRQLPCSLTGKEEIGDVRERKKSKSGLLDFLDVVKALVSDQPRNDSESVDFLETAKRQGLTFLRPRWWRPDVDE